MERHECPSNIVKLGTLPSFRSEVHSVFSYVTSPIPVPLRTSTGDSPSGPPPRGSHVVFWAKRTLSGIGGYSLSADRCQQYIAESIVVTTQSNTYFR
ncbi:MAG: hypothetical protein Q9169_003237 [Polycauliona sp. 2 TL-2023]